MNIFERFKNIRSKPPLDQSFEDELSARENPIDDSSTKGSMLRANNPLGSRFNKNIVYFLVAIGTVAVMGGILFGFDDTKEVKNVKQEEKRDPKKSDSLSNLPSTYAGTNQTPAKNNDNQINKNNNPQNAYIPSRQNSYQPPSSNAYYPNNNYAQNNSKVPFISTPINSGISKIEQEIADAKKSAIKFVSSFSPSVEATSKNNSIDIPTTQNLTSQNSASNNNSDQNQKISFLNQKYDPSIYLHETIQNPISPYEVQAGTLIPGIMISGINSDLPGAIVGQVRQSIYDSITGNYLLIPQGSKLIGSYDSQVSFGQERLLVVWTRLIFPNGSSINLEGLQGVDMSGYAGLSDSVNNHNGRIFTSVVLGSLLSAGAKMATGNDNSFSSMAGSGVAENVSQSAGKLLEKNLNIQPTIEIAPGFRFNVFVTKDIVLTPYQD